MMHFSDFQVRALVAALYNEPIIFSARLCMVRDDLRAVEVAEMCQCNARRFMLMEDVDASKDLVIKTELVRLKTFVLDREYDPRSAPALLHAGYHEPSNTIYCRSERSRY